MASAATQQRPKRVKRLVLLSPAVGYGKASESVRAQKRDERLQNLARLGPQGMAQARGHAMLGPGAEPGLLQFVQETMAQVLPAGYAQATHMLAQADLMDQLEGLSVALSVASGDADVITPLASCERVAEDKGVKHQSFAGAGHACHLQASQAVNALIFAFAQDGLQNGR
jgi:pimeloyl-ACP methyl ester carboxylesterase